MSDMAGGKATALFDWAAAEGHACLLLDYAGCGLSDGLFAEQDLLDWRGDILDVIDAKVDGPVVIVGSSMGGWLMLLTALALVQRDGPGRVAGLVGIAAAPDFTDWGFTDAEKATLLTEGRIVEPSDYDENGYVTTLDFWKSGEVNRLLDGEIPLTCPVRFIHGQADDVVPWEIPLRASDALHSDDVQTLLIKDGDHRLSRDADIASLLGLINGLLETP
jgi:pimeloyl-ACP methyl ester carboxylesterase